jgi:hypothetical protein
MNRYEVTCLKCKQSDILLIDDNSHAIINYGKGASTNLLAGRWRKDMQWGWECICSNDNRISKQEESFLSELVTKGDKRAIEDIKKSLKIDDKKQFAMVEV